ncbi:hypothetical protein AQUCO_03500036v1 [Aquilegia coerulea]|uniref:DUF1308 domain-containing protein n=1 Tax=Aquilegia coerulea TaxID=218851 RepID=A0A2G5CVZ1_AQUCA|nr:hypothetical protein AQUCO_03500036v1 [Aquilegia coerulea]
MVEDVDNKLDWEWEEARKRCIRASKQIENSLQHLTDSCKRTLLRLVNSELKFILTHLSSLTSTSVISLNIGYIECILHLLQNPLISNVSRLCKPSNHVYVDIVCTLDKTPVWFLVSDRNPNYISWSSASSHNNKGLKLRVEKVLAAAKSSLMLKPASIILFFANGVHPLVSHNLKHEFGAFQINFLDFEFFEEEFVEDGWINLTAAGRSYLKAQTFQIMLDIVEKKLLLPTWLGNRFNVEDARQVELFNEETKFILGEKFCSLLSTMNLEAKYSVKPNDILGRDLLNFDTTALIALVSGISNGGTDKLLATPETELRKRFKSNYQFVIAQVMSELQKPILEELTSVMSRKIGIICETVELEFKQLVSMCGGPNEKLRADQLLKCLLLYDETTIFIVTEQLRI